MYFLLVALFNLLIFCNAEIHLRSLNTLSFKIQTNRQRPEWSPERLVDVLNKSLKDTIYKSNHKYFASLQLFKEEYQLLVIKQEYQDTITRKYNFLTPLYTKDLPIYNCLATLYNTTPTFNLVSHTQDLFSNILDDNKYIQKLIFKDITFESHPINVIYINTQFSFDDHNQLKESQFDDLYKHINSSLNAVKIPTVVIATGFLRIFNSALFLQSFNELIDNKFALKKCYVYVNDRDIVDDFILVAVSAPDPYVLHIKNDSCHTERFDDVGIAIMYVEIEYKMKINRTKPTTMSTSSKTTEEIQSIPDTTTKIPNRVTTRAGVIKPSFVIITDKKEKPQTDPIVDISTSENISTKPHTEFSLTMHHKVIITIVVIVVLVVFIIYRTVKQNG